jgi:hypothetical protein
MITMSESGLMEIKPGVEESADHVPMDWQTIASAPFDRDLEVAVLDGGEMYALVFPCRRVLHGWINAKTAEPALIHPSHWREWKDRKSALSALGPGLARGGEL